MYDPLFPLTSPRPLPLEERLPSDSFLFELDGSIGVADGSILQSAR